MKGKRIIILMTAVLLTAWSGVEAGDWSLTRPGGVGFVLVGTHQDASQMQRSGLGLGAELFLRYPLSSRLTLSGGAGVYTATDDIFKMENQKSVFLPTLELRAELTLSRGEWFKPFVYSGIQFFGATSHVRGIEGAQYSGHSYQGCILAGLGADIYLGSSSWSLYLSSDYRYAVFSTITPYPQYWIGKAGLCFKLGNPKWLSQRREESEFPPEIMKLMSTTDADESMESSHYEAGNRWETGLLNERVSQMERCILQNANSIQEMAEHIQAYVQAVASFTNEGLYHSQRDNDVSRVVDENSYTGAYQKSLQKFKLGEYDEAIQILEDLRFRFPNHALASNCSYWIGECYHARGQYQEAIIEFENVFKYAVSHKYDDALLMKGKCYARLGNRKLANTNFQNLIDQYPDSEYVSTARHFLKSL